ncbi:MAG: hypothetical protein KDA44_19525 [Planctomycetales bacterium]|nr:hypothetical protein [Planctomycetales bacterium]
MFHATREITAPADRSLVLCMEPWTDEFILSPGSIAVISGDSEVEGEIEIEEKPDLVIAYGWQGSILQVSIDGSSVWEAWARLPVVGKPAQ